MTATRSNTPHKRDTFAVRHLIGVLRNPNAPAAAKLIAKAQLERIAKRHIRSLGADATEEDNYVYGQMMLLCR